jgi:hypothetical protein
MNKEQVQRYVKKFFKKYSTENLSRVFVNGNDYKKMQDMLEYINEAKPDFKFTLTPAIGDALYAIEKKNWIEKSIGVDGLKLTYDKEDDYFKFLLFKTGEAGDNPEKSILDFTIDRKDIHNEYIDGGYSPEGVTNDNVKGYIKFEDITIIKNSERLPDQRCYELAIDTFQTWVAINHFLIYHEKDIIVSDYKGIVQQKGKGGKIASKPIVIGKLYKTNLPDDWEPKSQRNYWVDRWPVKGYSRTITVNGPYDDFIAKKIFKLSEEEFELKEYAFIEEHPTLEGKIRVREKVKELEEVKRKLPLTEEASYAEKSLRTYHTNL